MVTPRSCARQWARIHQCPFEQQGLGLHWMQNAYIERFNGSFCRELLDAHLFRSLAYVRQLVDEWMLNYNTQRPHKALNFMTSIEFKEAA
jgi:putative transposase